jgi:hypothetical protein
MACGERSLVGHQALATVLAWARSQRLRQLIDPLQQKAQCLTHETNLPPGLSLVDLLRVGIVEYPPDRDRYAFPALDILQLQVREGPLYLYETIHLDHAMCFRLGASPTH